MPFICILFLSLWGNMNIIRKDNNNKKSMNRIVVAIILNAIIIGIIVVASVFVYRKMIEVEEQKCWDFLEESAESVETQINTKMEDNINVLKLVASSMLTENRMNQSEENIEMIRSHIEDVQALTIFNRIDVLFKNNKILVQNEGVTTSQLDFASLADNGIHVTDRMIDPTTGKESIYCVVPIEKRGKVQALLLGVLECDQLGNIFNTSIYDGEAIICIVDRSSGNFIMDPWHDSLGNVYEENKRKTLPGYEHIDVRDEILNGNTGVVAYESRVNGKASYMYFKPIRNMGWQLIVFVQDDSIFQSVSTLRKLLACLVIIEMILFISYFIWTALTLSHSIRRKDEFERLSYTDAGTGANNRQALYHRYESIKKAEHIGVIFCDINGLKVMNDTNGHNAGDQLIKDTYECLKVGFDAKDIFRMGGDEFIVINTEMLESQMIEKMNDVKNALEQKKIAVAMGHVWMKEHHEQIDQLISQAEKQMYLDKKQWYIDSGKERRKI